MSDRNVDFVLARNKQKQRYAHSLIHIKFNLIYLLLGEYDLTELYNFTLYLAQLG